MTFVAGQISKVTYYFVDPEGFEPSTFSMPLRRAPNCAMGPIQYTIFDFRITISNRQFNIVNLVDLRGFEPLTSSVRLRHAPNCATGPMIIPHNSRGKARNILLEA